MVLEPVLARVPHSPVQPGRALERGLAVQRGVDPAGQDLGGRERGGLEPAGTELQAQLGRADDVRRGQPAVVGRGLRQLDEHRDRLLQLVECRDHTAHVAGQVVEVPDRDLQPGDGQSQSARQLCRARQLTGAAGHTTDSGHRHPAHQR